MRNENKTSIMSYAGLREEDIKRDKELYVKNKQVEHIKKNVK